MQIPAQITFHNMDSSQALEERIRQKIEKIDGRIQDLVGFHVLVEAAHHHQTKGRLYSVRIEATLPGGKLVVSHHPGRNPIKHEKVYAAMNNAFAAIEKQLSRFKSQDQRREVKVHEANWHDGVVSNLVSAENYGFLATVEGDEVYFHGNAVHNDRFGDLDIGSRVRFVHADGEGRKGPQASAVKLARAKKAKEI